GHRDLGVAVLDLRADRIAVLGQQILAVVLDALARAEGQAAFGDRRRDVIEDMRPRMPELGIAPAGPGQAVGVALDRLGQAAQRPAVELFLMLHVQLEAFRALAGVAYRPAAKV